MDQCEDMVFGEIDLTVKIGRPDKGYMNPQIAVIRGAVKAEVDAKWYRGPCWVFRAAVEAYLWRLGISTEMYSAS